MADNGKTNEAGAAAAEPADGDQQVRNTVNQNDTDCKTEAYYDLIWGREIHVDEHLWAVNHFPDRKPKRAFH